MTQFMPDTVSKYLEGVVEPRTQYNLRRVLMALADRYSSQCLSSAGLVISSGGATTAKTGASTTNVIASGTPVQVSGGTTLPVLTGLAISAGFFNVAVFYCDSAGALTVAFGIQASTLAGVTFPATPFGKAILGFLIITYASAFTGGTTALDTATTSYVSPTGAFDPTVLTGTLAG